jgi:PhnB protein
MPRHSIAPAPRLARPTSHPCQRRQPIAVKPIPEGYHSVTPYLILDNATRALEFYKKALGAVELLRMPAPGGKIGHAEIKIGDSPIMLADENPEMGAKSARTLGGSPISLMVYVEDVDTRVAQAVAAGAKLTRPVANQFYGDRTGGVDDPFGYHWYLATHVEDVPPDELEKRAAKAMGA